MPRSGQEHCRQREQQWPRDKGELDLPRTEKKAAVGWSMGMKAGEWEEASEGREAPDRQYETLALVGVAQLVGCPPKH